MTSRYTIWSIVKRLYHLKNVISKSHHDRTTQLNAVIRSHPRMGEAFTDLKSGMTSTVVAKNVKKSSPKGTSDPSPS